MLTNIIKLIRNTLAGLFLGLLAAPLFAQDNSILNCENGDNCKDIPPVLNCLQANFDQLSDLCKSAVAIWPDTSIEEACDAEIHKFCADKVPAKKN